MNKQAGQTLFAVVVILGIIFLVIMMLLTYVMNNRIVTRIKYQSAQATGIAEAGIDKALWCLNNPDECAVGYSGETSTLGAGQYTTTLSSIGGDYSVLSTGTVNDKQKTLKATISQFATSAAASFYYGVQVGAGGLSMSNNAYVDGNIYSNGSIDALNGAYVTGDVYVAGGTALTADQEQTTESTEFIFRSTSTNTDIAQSFKAGVTEVINYVSLYLKKVSVPGNASVYITADNGGQPATTVLATGTLNASQVTESFGWIDVSFSSNPKLTLGTTYWIVIDNDSSHSSKYFISGKNANAGYGNGIGLYVDDWSTGDPWSDAFGDFTFKTWMGGIETHISGLKVGDTSHTCDDAHYLTHHGDAYAHSILNSTIECDAFYDTDITGSTIGRNGHPGSTDPAPEALPISDATILDWKDEAEAGGVHTGDYTIDGVPDSIGPLKITGNLVVENGATLTISGNIWVEGTITFTNLANIRLDPGYQISSGVILSDGKISVSNNCVFEGSGEDESFILILSTDTSLDENSPAIDINNNADTVIFYAGDGMIKVANNATLKEATAYRLHLAENASVSYVSGLANAKFSNGPGGIWTTQNSTWQEIE